MVHIVLLLSPWPPASTPPILFSILLHPPLFFLDPLATSLLWGVLKLPSESSL
jgi:hypothetical protein